MYYKLSSSGAFSASPDSDAGKAAIVFKQAWSSYSTT